MRPLESGFSTTPRAVAGAGMRFSFFSITDARRELRRLDEFITLAGSPAHQAKLVGPDGSEVALPDQVYDSSS
ncbi:hypothetical protein [Amycolatopsis sp. cmx-11-12]|uniref:hypothetical protein n=1 Tax=Amycolatopsis sp. cmx-11-12 TaxID=2785795 RepID=UPI003916EE52